MPTELQCLGEALKRRREERRVSLKEVENATSIRMVYIQYIENGEFGKLISPVHAQGFLRKYASFLEFEERQLFQDYPQALHALTTPSNLSPDLSGLGSVEVRGSPAHDQKWGSLALWIGGSAGGVLLLWWVGRSLGLV